VVQVKTHTAQDKKKASELYFFIIDKFPKSIISAGLGIGVISDALADAREQERKRCAMIAEEIASREDEYYDDPNVPWQTVAINICIAIRAGKGDGNE